MSERRDGDTSNLFSPVEIVGVVTDGVPISYYQLGTEGFLLTSLNRSYYVLDTAKLRVVYRSRIFPSSITALHGCGETVYVALQETHTICIFQRLLQLGTLTGHINTIRGLFTLGAFLISWSATEVLVWDLEMLQLVVSLPLTQQGRRVSQVLHPETYVNKIVVAFENTPELELWNFKTAKQVYSFRSLIDSTPPDWTDNSVPASRGVSALCTSIHPDILGVGLTDGTIILLDLKTDAVLSTFNASTENVAVTALTCRTDRSSGAAKGIFISGFANGDLAVWDSQNDKLVQVVEGAHESSSQGVSQVVAVPGEPLVITNGADNAIVMWIFDITGDLCRELRSRRGLASPVERLDFYDEEGKELLCLGTTPFKEQCTFARIGAHLQHQNCVFSQAKALNTITQKWRARLRCLPKARDLAFSYARHWDWPNIVTCHVGLGSVFLWSGHDKTLVARTVDLPVRYRPSHTSGAPLTATTLDVSGCGAYLVVGYSDGSIHKFNLQSGLHRGAFERNVGSTVVKAHTRSITEVRIISSGDTVLSTAEGETVLRYWGLRSQKMLKEIDVGALCGISSSASGYAISHLVRSSATSLIAAIVSCISPAAEDACSTPHLVSDKVALLDVESGILVRECALPFPDRISSAAFSRDGRWIVLALERQPHLLVYDILSSSLIDWVALDSHALAVAFAPSNAFLYVSQKNLPGSLLCLANLHIFSSQAAPLLRPAIREPYRLSARAFSGDATSLSLAPSQSCVDGTANVEQRVDQLPLPEPGQLVFSGESEKRLQAILHLEKIKERNRPRPQDVAVPENADVPFFLPTSGTQNDQWFLQNSEPLEADAPETSASPQKRPVTTPLPASRFESLLKAFADADKETQLAEADRITAYLKSLSPSGIHLALSAIGGAFSAAETTAQGRVPAAHLQALIDYFVISVHYRKEADFIQTVLHVFFQLHAEELQTLLCQEAAPLHTKLKHLRDLIHADWEPLDLQCHQAACFLKLLTHTQME